MNVASIKEKAQCILWLYNTRLAITIYCSFRKDMEKLPMVVVCIKNWNDKFKDTISIGSHKSIDSPSSSVTLLTLCYLISLKSYKIHLLSLKKIRSATEYCQDFALMPPVAGMQITNCLGCASKWPFPVSCFCC